MLTSAIITAPVGALAARTDATQCKGFYTIPGLAVESGPCGISDYIRSYLVVSDGYLYVFILTLKGLRIDTWSMQHSSPHWVDTWCLPEDLEFNKQIRTPCVGDTRANLINPPISLGEGGWLCIPRWEGGVVLVHPSSRTISVGKLAEHVHVGEIAVVGGTLCISAFPPYPMTDKFTGLILYNSDSIVHGGVPTRMISAKSGLWPEKLGLFHTALAYGNRLLAIGNIVNQGNWLFLIDIDQPLIGARCLYRQRVSDQRRGISCAVLEGGGIAIGTLNKVVFLHPHPTGKDNFRREAISLPPRNEPKTKHQYFWPEVTAIAGEAALCVIQANDLYRVGYGGAIRCLAEEGPIENAVSHPEGIVLHTIRGKGKSYEQGKSYELLLADPSLTRVIGRSAVQGRTTMAVEPDAYGVDGSSGSFWAGSSHSTRISVLTTTKDLEHVCMTSPMAPVRQIAPHPGSPGVALVVGNGSVMLARDLTLEYDTDTDRVEAPARSGTEEVFYLEDGDLFFRSENDRRQFASIGRGRWASVRNSRPNCSTMGLWRKVRGTIRTTTDGVEYKGLVVVGLVPNPVDAGYVLALLRDGRLITFPGAKLPPHDDLVNAKGDCKLLFSWGTKAKGITAAGPHIVGWGEDSMFVVNEQHLRPDSMRQLANVENIKFDRLRGALVVHQGDRFRWIDPEDPSLPDMFSVVICPRGIIVHVPHPDQPTNNHPGWWWTDLVGDASTVFFVQDALGQPMADAGRRTAFLRSFFNKHICTDALVDYRGFARRLRGPVAAYRTQVLRPMLPAGSIDTLP